jgi:hypothetical protein
MVLVNMVDFIQYLILVFILYFISLILVIFYMMDVYHVIILINIFACKSLKLLVNQQNLTHSYCLREEHYFKFEDIFYFYLFILFHH